MKLKELKPSVGMMRLWIASIVVCFIFTIRDSFDGEKFFSSIFLNLFRLLAKLLVDIVSGVDGVGSLSIITIHLILGLSATLVYVITSALVYVLVIWVKEGFSKSKDGN